MRAHRIEDESGSIDDDDPASDWEDKLGRTNVPPPSNKRMYALRTDPNRLKSCCVCEDCGKEFLSWKSFLEHGKCSFEDAAESLVSTSSTDDSSGDVGGGDDVTRRACGRSKRKRSLRANMGHFTSICPSSEEEDLANCLMMLSNATVDHFIPKAEAEESCASASKEDQERRNTMNFVASIACRVPMEKDKGVAEGVAKGLFECKACKKVFNSHQALGGHRASHKKVRGCFAAKLDHIDDSQADEDHDVITNEEFYPTKSSSTLQFDQGTSKKKSKVHECSVCHRVFSSGQALGGHKRCHWVTSNSPDTSFLAKFHHQFQDHMVMMEQIQQIRRKFIDQNSDDHAPDLNLPATIDHHYDLNVRRNHVNPSSIDDVSTEIYLQPWIIVDAKEKPDINQHQLQVIENDKINNCSSSMQNANDEAENKVKLAKLSELKDINVGGGGSSPWLQVGIGSTTNVGSNP